MQRKKNFTSLEIFKRYIVLPNSNPTYNVNDKDLKYIFQSRVGLSSLKCHKKSNRTIFIIAPAVNIYLNSHKSLTLVDNQILSPTLIILEVRVDSK